MNQNITKHIICLILITNLAISQFVDIETNIDLRQIRENDRFYFDDIVSKIDDFFILNNFGADIEYLELGANLHLIIETLIEHNNQQIINGQIIITNRADIMMPLKSFSFPISELNNISYNPHAFTPLSSLLEFIANLLIANELDTYDSKGGNEYYNIALSISQLGKDDDYSKGWNERWKKCKGLQENFFLRDIKYYYFLAYEDWHNKDFENLKTNIDFLHTAIKANNSFIGIDNNTINFFKAYSGEIVTYYSKINFTVGLEFLSQYDTNNKSIYLNALKSLKE